MEVAKGLRKRNIFRDGSSRVIVVFSVEAVDKGVRIGCEEDR
jgi:hypothetical protein